MDAAKDKQTAILEQNDAILDKFHEELKDSADGLNKVKIEDFKSPSFYLPPISKVFALLGFITNQKQLIDLFETTYETPLNISRTNKYAFFKQGVGLRTVSKIVNWLKIIPFPFEQLTTKKMMAKTIRSNRAGSNAGAWLSGVSGIQTIFKRFGKTKHEFTLLFDFIEQRCNTEVDLFLRIKEEVKAGKLAPDDIAAAWKAQDPLWKNNLYIPLGVIENFAELLLLHNQGKKLNEQQTLSTIESYVYLYFDFFLEAITHYEVGCRICYGKNKDKIENDLGMITKAIYAYSTQENIKTCFAGLLKEFKDVLSETIEETSYRKLATFIEIEESESSISGESIEDKQYNQLKDWRNGVNLPSSKKLTAFLQKLDEYAKTSSGFVTFDMCRIAMGVDKLVNEFLDKTKSENCNQADVEIIIKKVLANIPNYYKTNLKTEFEKRKPAT
ncbi:hypothetical protein EKO29_15860 [Colwellia sp. Arc7-635]|uniref:hypothetical protein n=1 Tax=Colwellia sp. Arc7-635 TaxID=2497879 RepID=UPI000F851B48|nr:hypothetical protein [Colwellia sp. Arc7-635]AZQ85324.1 hypothetical protein EKO29_15860 [Colwellia sp. Arc7-635]